MCGIIGYIGRDKAIKAVISGLEKLEYRGYDSSGICYINENKLVIKKELGKIKNLKEKLNLDLKSNLGIGHTRWATHGVPSVINSHPHKVGNITIVHNGIIENYVELKNELSKDNITFTSDTDTEVACALLYKLYKETNDIKKTIIKFKEKVTGSYAIGMIIDDDFDHLYAIKCGSPLIIGTGNNENFIASDVPAILEFTNKYILLDDDEFAILSKDHIACFDKNGKKKEKNVNTFDSNLSNIELNGYEHYMLKEIYEQPNVFKNTVNSIDELPDLSKFKNIVIVACGSAYHAGLVGKYLIETFGNISVNVEIASEFRYKKLFIDKSTLVIAISQSGETADTKEAVKISKELGATTLGIINVYASSIARICDMVIYTKAGSEIAVATTKAYLAQVTIFSLIAKKLCNSVENYNKIPALMEKIFNSVEKINEIAKKIYKNEDIFFIGRKCDYATCLEASLKLKEISYIHSEAYAAGELKHGTISLIKENTVVIALATDDKIVDKTISNIKEVKARGAFVILFTDDLHDKDYDCYDIKFTIPTTSEIYQPILNVIPFQLLSYEVAKLRGCDIDKPRNLAKSVTVE